GRRRGQLRVRPRRRPWIASARQRPHVQASRRRAPARRVQSRPASVPVISELYHENTKLGPHAGSHPTEYAVDELAVVTRAYKEYRLHRRVALPQPTPTARPFEQVAGARRTVRAFADAGHGLGQPGKALHHTH